MTRGCARSRSAKRGSLSSDTRPTTPFPAEPGFEQLRGLTEVSRALTYTTSLEQVTRITVDRSAQLLDASSALLMLVDTAGVMQVRAVSGAHDDEVERFHAPFTDELMPRLQALLGVDSERFLAVPLVVGGEVTGLLAVATQDTPTPADEWLLSAMADQAAVALENARLGGEVRLEMEERLRASDDATSTKDRALSTLAHDIRSPLGAIEGYCGVLEAEIYGPINDRQRETLARVRMSGRHLLSLLDNVMDMARLDAGVVRVAAVPVRLIDVAREAAHILGPASEAKRQVLEFGVMDDVIVLADPDRLRQVLVNLIGNAVKFTPDEGTVTVCTRLVDEDGVSCGEIRVSDSGPGVAAAEQEAVFEAYYRSEETAGAGGVGLGLAISHGLVERMGGKLLLESAPARGATFIVRLPGHTQPA